VPNLSLEFMIINASMLKKHGIDMSIHFKISDAVFDCDTLMIIGRYFDYLEKEDRVTEAVAGIRKKVKRLIWFDDADSTGSPVFAVMPYVDKYLKKQLLTDLSLYHRTFHIDRIFTEYYKPNHARSIPSRKPLRKGDEKKLGLSYNLAYVNYQDSKIRRAMHLFLPFTYGPPHFTDPQRDRTLDVNTRFSLRYDPELISYQRKRSIGLLDPSFKISGKERISLPAYLKELEDSKIALSPFGYGEVNYRDFEAMIKGACLLKPDLSHMRTWPDIFRPMETYVPYKWDFSDLNEKIRLLLKDPRLRISIAKNAQESYRRLLDTNGMEGFCDHVASML